MTIFSFFHVADIEAKATHDHPSLLDRGDRSRRGSINGVIPSREFHGQTADLDIRDLSRRRSSPANARPIPRAL
nr:hypothetical protein [Candidatus Sigynarchaeota archaeon]